MNDYGTVEGRNSLIEEARSVQDDLEVNALGERLEVIDELIEAMSIPAPVDEAKLAAVIERALVAYPRQASSTAPPAPASLSRFVALAVRVWMEGTR